MPQRNSDQGIRLLAQVAISVVVWLVAAYVVNSQLSSHEHSPVVRAALAGAGIAAFLVWLSVAARVLFAQDEFSQRVHLVALAAAFAATAAISLSADFLRKAGFVSALPFENAWILMAVLWSVALVATSRYYR